MGAYYLVHVVWWYPQRCIRGGRFFCSHTSRVAQHLIEHNHTFGTIHNTMQILRHHRKGPHFNTLERFHMYAEYITNNHINDNQTAFPNKIFDVLLKAYSQGNPPPIPAP
jgi:hypothetical protein